MTTLIHFPLAARDPLPPTFPRECVGCGAVPVTESCMLAHRLVMRGQKQVQASVELKVPHCDRCARTTKSVFLAGCVPFVLGGLLAGLAVFVLVFLLATRVGLDSMTDGEEWPSLILAASAGLFGGLAAGFVFEVAARVLLLPLLGPALLRAPLLAAQFLSDSDYVAGLTARLNPDCTRLELRFARPDTARAFAALNSAAGANPPQPHVV